MMLYQIAPDNEDHPEWWLVVSDDMNDELAGPFKEKGEAEEWMRVHSDSR